MDLPISTTSGSRYLKSFVWWLWKNLQILVRSHLSHVFAFILGILVLIREWHVLFPLIRFEHLPNSEELLILIVTLGTIAGALWEFFGNKLSTTPQEVRFVATIRALLIELEKFTYGTSKDKSPKERLSQFTDSFLDATCEAMCGKKLINGAFMWQPPDSDHLALINKSSNAKYLMDLEIPLPTSTESDITGPAGIAHTQTRVVYMPLKRWKLSWPMRLVKNGKERYETLDPCYGWVKGTQEMERCTSVLCLPVAVYLGPKKREAFGVLNYSTRSLDPFVDRDYMMGECFASILAQATAAAQREKFEAEQHKPGG